LSEACYFYQDKTVLNQSIEFPRYSSSIITQLYLPLAKRSFWVKAVWCLILLVGMGYQTYLAFNYNSNETTNTALIIGRIAAYNLLILIVLLWLPVMRHTATKLRHLGMANWLPLDSVKNIHRWLGHALFVAALLHGASYLVYFDSLEGDLFPIYSGQESDLVRSMETTMYEFVTEDESIDDVREWVANGWDQQTYHNVIAPLMKEDCTKCHSTGSTMTYAVISLPLTDFESVKSMGREGIESRQFRINMAGTAMLIFFSVIWLTSLAFLRKRYYHWFQHIHRLSYIIAVLALLHIPRFEYCLFPSVLLLIEYWLNRKVKGWYHCKTKIKLIGNQIIDMEINLPEPVYIKSGHYVQLRIRPLSKREWHSISLVNGGEHSHTFRLMIKNMGDWTEKLYEIGECSQEIEVDVRGIYASPIANADKAKQVFCVAGGIGITPVMSLVNDYQKQPDKWERLSVVWVFQDWSLLENIMEWLLSAQEHNPSIQWQCFATTPCPEDMQIPKGIKIINRRPCISTNIDQFERGEGGLMHAYVCGPKSLSNEVFKQTRKRENWRVTTEHF